MKYYMTFLSTQIELKDAYLTFDTEKEAEEFGKKINMQFSVIYPGTFFKPSYFPKGELTKKEVMEYIK